MSADGTDLESGRLSRLLGRQGELLAGVARGAPLKETLDGLAALVREQTGGAARCAVLLADATQQQLRFVSARDVPEGYRQAIAPYLRAGAKMGTCATALHRRKAVYTRDTAICPLWENIRDIALRNGLRAIWSTPILSGDVLLGTLALYYEAPNAPSDKDTELIDMAVQLARVAIERSRDEEVLKGPFENSPAGRLILDAGGTIVRANKAFAALLGYAPDELQGRNIVTVSPDESHDRFVQRLQSLGESEVGVAHRFVHRDGTALIIYARCSLCRNRSGALQHVLWRVVVAGDADKDPLALLSRREMEVLERVVAGATSKEIAGALHLSPSSVDTYRSRIMVKLGVDNLADVVRFAVERGIAA